MKNSANTGTSAKTWFRTTWETISIKPEAAKAVLSMTRLTKRITVHS
jgi:hypothetical protein